MEKINTILITGTSAAAVHSFTTEAHAREVMRAAVESCGSASAFMIDAADARMVYEVSPQLRVHVAEAKLKLQRDLRFKECLDQNGVPLDPELRQAIHKAFGDYVAITTVGGGVN